MPLVKATLAAALKSLAENPPGKGAPNPEQVQANAWGDAVGSYISTVAPPANPAGVAAAVTALKASLTSAFSTPQGAGPLMETAFTTFGAAVGAAMAPAFVAVPPVVPPQFSTFFAAQPSGDFTTAANAVADLIDLWARTGTATPIPPAPPTPVPWS